MGNVQMHATLTPDGQRFLHRLQKSLPFVAHMSGIERIEWCGRFGEFDHFLGLAPATWSIDRFNDVRSVKNGANLCSASGSRDFADFSSDLAASLRPLR